MTESHGTCAVIIEMYSIYEDTRYIKSYCIIIALATSTTRGQI